MFIPVASAQTGDGWDIGDGWEGYPTPTPNPVVVNVFGNFYAAILLFSIVGILSVVSVIVIFLKGNADGAEVAKVAAVLIIIALCSFVAVVICFTMQSAMTF